MMKLPVRLASAGRKGTVVGGALALGVLLTANNRFITASAQESASKPQSVSASSYFTATADAATGKVRVESVSAGARVRPRAVTAKSGFTCIIQTKRGQRLVGYQPLEVFGEGNSYENDWLLSPYSVKHARVLRGKNT